MESETLLLIIGAVIVSLLIAVFQYLYKSKEEGKINVLLSFLRFTSIFSILLLLINPSIQNKIIEIIKPSLNVAIDNSKSIYYNKQSANVNTMVELFSNDKTLNEKFSINYYEVGTNISLLDSLEFNESQTNLSLPFKEFSKLNKTDNYEPLVLISDGNQTVGNSLEFIDFKSPVYPVIVGDTTTVNDILISQINVNRNTSINNNFPVEVFVNYYGDKPISKRLSIFTKGNRVYSKILNFDRSGTSISESVFLKGLNKGRQFYSVRIEELNNEKNTSNNSKNFAINVIEEKSNILILSSIIHPDLGMLKKSIESDKTRSVSIVKPQNFSANLSSYDLVIMYQPQNSFERYFKEIENKKINYFIITGLSTDWNFLNKIQNNFSKILTNETEKIQPKINLDFPSFLINDVDFSAFAPLEDKFGEIVFKIKNENLLFQKIGLIETTKPLLSTFEIENQRCAVLFGENSWKWRVNSFSSNKNFIQFDGFISSLTQYLVSNRRKNRLSVYTKSLYYSNELIEFSANYFDNNLKFDNRAKLLLTVTNEENSFIKKVPFSLSDNRFIAEISGIPEGEYRFRVNVENQKTHFNGKFKILPFEIEQQNSNANYSNLKKISEKTEGEIFYNQADDLISSLKNDKRFQSIQKSKSLKSPLIEWKWLLGFIIISLGLEWFIRKYYGKI